MAAPHYFLHRLRGYRRHGHRLLQALPPPPPPCIVANEGHATGSLLPFIGRCCCCRLPHLQPRSSAAAGRSVRWPRNQIEEGERPSKRPSSSLRPLDRPRPRRFRLRLLDRRRARWRRATRSTNRRRSGSLPGAIVPERTLAYYVELFLVSLSTTPYYTTDEEYYIFVIHPYTTLFWVRRRS